MKKTVYHRVVGYRATVHAEPLDMLLTLASRSSAVPVAVRALAAYGEWRSCHRPFDLSWHDEFGSLEHSDGVVEHYAELLAQDIEEMEK